MKILWLSWRDIRNPDAGGAEKVAIGVTSRLAKDGHNVTIFTSQFKNAFETDTIRKVNVIRRGNRLTCRFWAFLYYLNNKDFDLIVDEINTIPFFTVLYARKKSIALIHQLAREYWFTQTLWPLNRLGYWLEPHILKLYKNRPTLVVSKSTQKDLKKLNFKNIKVIREGLDFKPQLVSKKENLILFIGRLTAAKGPQDAIAAFKTIIGALPDTKLIVVGQGELKFTQSLKNFSKKLRLGHKINFVGYISDSAKINLLAQAKVVLIPSVREGWNLVATEANATGCVPIAYNVAGLRDSIKNNQTGILVGKTPENLAQATIELLKDDTKRREIVRNGFEFAKKFSWENTYKDIKSFILK